MTVNYDRLYFVKSNKYLYKFYEFKDIKELSDSLYIDYSLLERLYDDEYKCELVGFSVAKKISDYIKEPFDNVWELADLRSKIPTDKQLVIISDEIIKGLENNIISKLQFLNIKEKKISEIMELIDEIVAESVLFGTELYKKGNAKQIEKLAQKVKNK